LSQKAFNGLATKFRNFFAICRHNNLRLINQKFSPQKAFRNEPNEGGQIAVESFCLAIKLILMSYATPESVIWA